MPSTVMSVRTGRAIGERQNTIWILEIMKTTPSIFGS